VAGLMCRVLKVTPSANYAWRSRAPSKQAQARTMLDVEIEAVSGREAPLLEAISKDLTAR
jgi:hypothetical protein